MKFLLSLSWKNLTRYTRRTLITAVALAYGVGLFIFIDAWLKGAEMESERNLIWYETGEAQIISEQYWEHKDTMPLKYAMDNTSSILQQLEDRNIEATPRIQFSGDLVFEKDPYPEYGSMTVRIIAIDPDTDDDVYNLKDTIVDGNYLKSGENGVVVGGWLAEDIGAEVGFPITISTRTKYNTFQTIRSTIVGIVQTENPIVNRNAIYLPIEIADLSLDMEGTRTHIVLNLKGDDSDKVAAEAIALNDDLNLNGAKVFSWKDLAGDYIAMAEAKQGGTKMVLFLIVLIALVGITNTMLMAIFERVRELGMMRAMGFTDGQIRLSFMMEAAGIGVLGSAMGFVLGIVLNIWIINWGVDFGWMLRDLDVGYRLSGVMRGAWNWDSIILAVIAGIVVSVLVALIPVRRAIKMEITDCLRHQ